MWHWIYKSLSPKNRYDLVGKLVFFCLVISVFNYGFNQLLPEAPELPISYIVLSSFAVGGPFVILFFALLTRQVILQKTLVQLARFDSLTGLANRRHFLKQAELAIAEDEHCVLLLLDVDHFKKVNDNWGHPVGDECLRSVAYILERSARTDDIVGRLGGEEFGIILRDTSVDRISGIRDKLLKPIPYNAGEALQHLSGTVSIGACQISRGGNLHAALVAADLALYQAKANGRARLEIAQPVALAS